MKKPSSDGCFRVDRRHIERLVPDIERQIRMEITMRAAFMPFTYLSAPAARLFAGLVGPLVVYQPLETNIPSSMSALASEGIVDLRTPVTEDDGRMRTALAEFTQWAQMNPGKSTAGTGYLGARQGEIPFFNESTINRIRSDIRRFQQHDGQAERTETLFSARLFLSLAQENDLAMDRLDQDLDHFDALEKAFLETLDDANDAAFDRQGIGSRVWREDPGSRLTSQRIRAWAGLAAADAELPNWLLTTSPAVASALLENFADDLHFEKVAELHLPGHVQGGPPLLGEALTALSIAPSAPPADLSVLPLPTAGGEDASGLCIRLYAAADRTPAQVIRTMAPKSSITPASADRPDAARHTLLLLADI